MVLHRCGEAHDSVRAVTRLFDLFPYPDRRARRQFSDADLLADRAALGEGPRERVQGQRFRVLQRGQRHQERGRDGERSGLLKTEIQLYSTVAVRLGCPAQQVIPQFRLEMRGIVDPLELPVHERRDRAVALLGFQQDAEPAVGEQQPVVAGNGGRRFPVQGGVLRVRIGHDTISLLRMGRSSRRRLFS